MEVVAEDGKPVSVDTVRIALSLSLSLSVCIHIISLELGIAVDIVSDFLSFLAAAVHH